MRALLELLKKNDFDPEFCPGTLEFYKNSENPEFDFLKYKLMTPMPFESLADQLDEIMLNPMCSPNEISHIFKALYSNGLLDTGKPTTQILTYLKERYEKYSLETMYSIAQELILQEKKAVSLEDTNKEDVLSDLLIFFNSKISEFQFVISGKKKLKEDILDSLPAYRRYSMFSQSAIGRDLSSELRQKVGLSILQGECPPKVQTIYNTTSLRWWNSYSGTFTPKEILENPYDKQVVPKG
jgi:hypothetical protein